MRTLILLLLVATALASVSSVQAETLSKLEAEYNALHSVQKATFNLSEAEQTSAITMAYEEKFRSILNDDVIRETKDNDLGWIMKAAYLAAFYSRQPRYLDDLRLVSSEIERRGVATDDQRVMLFRALIGYREFGEARAYLSEHPSLDVEPIPAMDDAQPPQGKDPLVYAVGLQEPRLWLRQSNISDGIRLVVVSHPLCAFSRAAMQAMETDPAMNNALAGKVIWLAPADMYLHFNEVQAWNRDHPTTAVVITRYHQDWPMINHWATPNFYLLRNGEVLDHFSGWPKDGSHRDRLVELLERGDLL